ncbi:MAG: nuclear transport factor 2 family protein [Janthinobacterium lividum]
MTRLTFVCAIVLSALVLSPSHVYAQSQADVRQAIQARYDQFDRAYMKKDFPSVGKVFTPDCVMELQGEGRSMNAPRVIKGMRAVSKFLTVSHAKTRIVSVKPQGSAYAVSAVWTGDSSYIPAKGAQDDRPRHSRTQQAYLDTWKKTGTGWQIAHRSIQG